MTHLESRPERLALLRAFFELRAEFDSELKFFFTLNRILSAYDAPAAEWNILVARLVRVPPEFTAEERETFDGTMVMMSESPQA